jgi:hypothetical protein
VHIIAPRRGAPHSELSASFLDNAVIGNYIADNGADTADAATPATTGINVFGVTPITGTTIAQNVIEREGIAIAVSSGSQVDAHLNDLLNHQVGVANLGDGTVDATENPRPDCLAHSPRHRERARPYERLSLEQR